MKKYEKCVICESLVDVSKKEFQINFLCEKCEGVILNKCSVCGHTDGEKGNCHRRLCDEYEKLYVLEPFLL